MSAKKILIVDDELRIRKLVGDFLKREGYIAIEAENGKIALDIFNTEEGIDLVILDVMMPEYDGWTVCREIRKISNVPIIMLTARSEEFDELFGFEMGADEYVTKPFSPKILVARVNALLRRVERKEDKIKSFDGLQIDENAHIVYVEGKAIDLSPKEYELLLYMVENKGKALGREQILNKIWGYDYFGELRTVDTHINRLRIKLEKQSKLIKTVRGVGYRFEVEK
ncbi:response regulator transcription factor [Tepidibacter formicigenes]|uniref:Stage 0 sporulation protein A homolog n=1 Tax=Tepidibacter formicigenes DSM 15518 TaxID=1123349 RepID=A0A1M6S9F1_9FIRM|nr:response regulator transcription factor [Tepidibacter formicigenes]SHK41335.1 DNA-binding response regulator, OmpR family, contains REC and winged-helix (wHTH) domain [Tepidibacter formicigenes DSM 15518]